MSRPWVAIDFETASRERASACALGIALIINGSIAEERSWLIQPPGNYYEPMNTRVHGIDEDMTWQAPEFDEVWSEIEPYLSGAALLAHNAPFDIAVLRASLERYELSTPDAEYVCTVSMARKVWPRLANHKLPTVCDHCGIELAHHDAGSDAAACARIALRCRRESGTADLDSLAAVLGLRAGRL